MKNLLHIVDRGKIVHEKTKNPQVPGMFDNMLH